MATFLEDYMAKKKEIDALGTKAKGDLRKKWEDAHSKVTDIENQYFEIFGESIAPKGDFSSKPLSIDEVKAFLELKAKGEEIKLTGRRSKTIATLEKAFADSKDKTPEDILAKVI